MEAALKAFAEAVALACEFAAVVLIALGAARALARLLWRWRAGDDRALKKDIWMTFAGGIALALEFALAADVARTAIAPTWREIGQLAAIAAIRTALNLFLERDLETIRGLQPLRGRSRAGAVAAPE